MTTRNAYLILAHNDPAHLAALVDALRRESDVYIHLDLKAEFSQFKFIADKPNVSFIAERSAVSYAGISMVDAIIEMMAEAMNADVRYGHVTLLTGADFPLRHARDLNQMFNDNPTREFIKFSDVRETPRYLKLVNRRHYREPFVRSRNKVVRIFDSAVRKALSSIGLKNHWDERIVPYRGHTWCTITGECCQYIVRYNRDNPWFRDMNIHTFAPDEHYFHTIIAQSPFAKNSLGFQRCQGGLGPMVTTHMIDASLLRWFTLADWQDVAESDKLFVRKVRSLDGATLVEKIKRELHEARPAMVLQRQSASSTAPNSSVENIAVSNA